MSALPKPQLRALEAAADGLLFRTAFGGTYAGAWEAPAEAVARRGLIKWTAADFGGVAAEIALLTHAGRKALDEARAKEEQP